MNNDLFVERNSSRNVEVDTSNISTKGRGCLSVIVTAPVFGLIVGLATYTLGYGTTNAIYAGLATMGIVFGLHVFTTLAMFALFAGAAALFGIVVALWLGTER